MLFSIFRVLCFFLCKRKRKLLFLLCKRKRQLLFLSLRVVSARTGTDWNAGDWNAVDWNAGDWNAGSLSYIIQAASAALRRECSRTVALSTLK